MNEGTLQEPKDESLTSSRGAWSGLLLIAALGAFVGGLKYPELGSIGGALVGAAAFVVLASTEDREISGLRPRFLAPRFAALGLVFGVVVTAIHDGPGEVWEYFLGPLAVAAGFGAIGALVGGAIQAVSWTCCRMFHLNEHSELKPQSIRGTSESRWQQ